MTAQVVGVLGRGVVPADEPVVTADDLGLTRGDGCFDATRVVTSSDGSSVVEHLDAHLDRFARSIAGLSGEPLDRDAWRDLIAQLAAAWTQPGEAVLKIMWTRGAESRPGQPTGVATVTTLPEALVRARSGMRLACLQRGTASDLYRDVPWLLGRVKSLSYAINVAATREARARGADDALFVSSDGFCLEGPTSALIVLREGALVTTPIEGTGILDSITQAFAFAGATAAGVDCRSELMTVDEVAGADGVWMVSSVRGIAPVVAMDDRPVAQAPEWTARLAVWAGFGS